MFEAPSGALDTTEKLTLAEALERLERLHLAVEAEYDANYAQCRRTRRGWRLVPPGLMAWLSGVCAAMGLAMIAVDAPLLGAALVVMSIIMVFALAVMREMRHGDDGARRGIGRGAPHSGRLHRGFSSARWFQPALAR